MGRVIGVMGESGSGKTTAMRTLDPTTTYYIDADRKGLSWQGWRKQYSKEAGNYASTDNPDYVLYALASLACDEETREEVARKIKLPYQPLTKEAADSCRKMKVVVVDTLNGLMVAHEMRNIQQKGYDKWTDLASFVWGLVDYALKVRNDLTVIFCCHSETYRDDFGNIFTRIKTNGRKLEKIVLESKMPVVLLAGGVDSEYKFFTRHPSSTCKTPLGAFGEDAVPNDMAAILAALEEY